MAKKDSWHCDQMFFGRFLVSAVVAAFLSLPAEAAFVCPHFEDDAKRAMDGWQVPGMAIGILPTTGPPLFRVYGVEDIESREPVTTKTIFGTGSLAKSVTALAITASDLSLDTEPHQSISYFPNGISMRHLLSHTAGWARHDALWYLNAYDRKKLSIKLGLLPRFSHPGQVFQYNNVAFAAAGVAVEQLFNTNWHDWIQAVVLRPAGMTGAVTRYPVFREHPSRAAPYFPAHEGRITLALRDTDPVAPAAGLYAHVEDMVSYLRLLTQRGKISGQQIVPAEAVDEIMKPVTPRYGLGFRLTTWRGERLVFHPGFIDGYGARLSLLPDQKAGVVVLSNMSGETPTARIVSQAALDCLIGAPFTDWVARFGHRRKLTEPIPPVPPSSPLDRPVAHFAGTFEHPAYGTFSFSTRRKATLSGTFHGREFQLSYAGGNRWRLTETHWPLRKGLIFSFADLTNDEFQTLKTPLADGPTYRHNAGPLTFKRKASM